MSVSYTTDTLLASVANYTLDELSATSEPYTVTQALQLADDLILSVIIPFFQSLREEYYVSSELQSLTANQSEYDIPRDAIANKLRDVRYVDSGGLEWNLPLLPAADTWRQQFGSFQSRSLHGFYIRSNQIVVVPTPTQSSGSLKLYYYKRPKKMVPESSAAQIATLTDSDTVTVSTAPSFLTSGADVVIQSEASPFTLWDDTISVTTFSDPTVDFAEDYNANVEVGDWITDEGTVVIPEIPVECRSWLAQLLAQAILEGRGDVQGAAVLASKLEKTEKSLLTLFTPRVTGEPKKLVSPYNILRGRSSRRGNNGLW